MAVTCNLHVSMSLSKLDSSTSDVKNEVKFTYSIRENRVLNFENLYKVKEIKLQAFNIEQQLKRRQPHSFFTLNSVRFIREFPIK